MTEFRVLKKKPIKKVKNSPKKPVPIVKPKNTKNVTNEK